MGLELTCCMWTHMKVAHIYVYLELMIIANTCNLWNTLNHQELNKWLLKEGSGPIFESCAIFLSKMCPPHYSLAVNVQWAIPLMSYACLCNTSTLHFVVPLSQLCFPSLASSLPLSASFLFPPSPSFLPFLPFLLPSLLPPLLPLHPLSPILSV